MQATHPWGFDDVLDALKTFDTGTRPMAAPYISSQPVERYIACGRSMSVAIILANIDGKPDVSVVSSRYYGTEHPVSFADPMEGVEFAAELDELVITCLAEQYPEVWG